MKNFALEIFLAGKMIANMAVLGAVKFESEAAARAHLEKMWKRRAEERELLREARLREERQLLKRALHRTKTAEKWRAEGQEVAEELLSLEWQYIQVVLDEEMKRRRRDFRAVGAALGAPRRVWGSLP